MLALIKNAAKLSFAQKIIALPSIATLALLAVLGLTIHAAHANRDRLTSLRDAYYPSVQGSRNLQEIIVALERSHEDAVKTNSAFQLRAAAGLAQRFETTRADLVHNPVSDHAALDSLGRAFAAYARLAADTTHHAIALADEDSITAQYAAIRRSLGDLTLRDTKEIATAFDSAQHLQRTTFAQIVTVVLAATILLIALAIYAVRSLTKPMRAAVHAADRIAQGDMTVAIDVHSQDEIGQLMHSMRAMVTYLQEMAAAAQAIARGEVTHEIIPRSDADAFGRDFAAMALYLRDVAQVAERVANGDLAVRVEPRSANDVLGRAFVRMADYLQEMAQLGRQIAEGNVGVRVTPRSTADGFAHAFVGMTESLSQMASSIRGSAGAMAVASTQVSGSAVTLSGGTRDETAAVQSTLAHAERMSALALETARHGAALQSMAERDTRIMEEGSTALRETIAMMQTILTRIAVIDEIATETNVLALNAMIEAARAGSAGRGFNVVATEVRSLSERSRQTAIDIRELAAKSEKITGRSGSILTELAHSMTQTMSIVRDVSTAAADQSTGIAEITAAMRQVNHVASQNSAAAEDLAATAQEMSAQAEAMQALVGFFREADDVTRPSAALTALGSE